MHALRQGQLARHPGLLLLSSVSIPGIQEPPDPGLTRDGLGATVSQHIGREGQEDGQAVSQKTDSPLSHMDLPSVQPRAASIEQLSFCEISPFNFIESGGRICLSEQRSDVDVAQAQAGCGCWSPH